MGSVERLLAEWERADMKAAHHAHDNTAFVQRACAGAMRAALREQPEARGVVDEAMVERARSAYSVDRVSNGEILDAIAGRELANRLIRGILTAAQQPGQEGGGASLTNPWTGEPRDYRDVNSDPAGTLCVEPGAPLKAAPPSAPVGVEGTWLWCKLMDWCREHRIAPATQDKLFAIAGEAHRLNALTQQPAQAAPGVPDGCVLVLRSRIQGLADVLDADGDEWAAATEMREWLATPPGDDAAGGKS